ncbi:indole-3-glycerol phosphate synthase TrpC [Liquorilactobacillus ghanensis]|uniref:indole-3-glycerol phosphate synthase TrpC n=1 Tax=Liquorilactobacillus ghanensis TaxID=399370 RepID=UPI0039E881D8
MILTELVKSTQQKMQQRQVQMPLKQLQNICEQLPVATGKASFIHSLTASPLAVIAEIKQASPSKGVIVKQLPYRKIAAEYQAAGVAAISILTEEDHFKGKLAYLTDVAQQVSVPLLRKDFTIDPYLIYEAKAAGASIILLIAAILDDKQLQSYLDLAASLGLAAIVEVHNEAEVKRVLTTSAEIIGINNRNLTNFHVDLATTCRLSSLIPSNRLVIAESGIHQPADVAFLEKNARINGILVGEYLMRANNKVQTIKELKQIADDENQDLRN